MFYYFAILLYNKILCNKICIFKKRFKTLKIIWLWTKKEKQAPLNYMWNILMIDANRVNWFRQNVLLKLFCKQNNYQNSCNVISRKITLFWSSSCICSKDKEFSLSYYPLVLPLKLFLFMYKISTQVKFQDFFKCQN